MRWMKRANCNSIPNLRQAPPTMANASGTRRPNSSFSAPWKNWGRPLNCLSRRIASFVRATAHGWHMSPTSPTRGVCITPMPHASTRPRPTCASMTRSICDLFHCMALRSIATRRPPSPPSRPLKATRKVALKPGCCLTGQPPPWQWMSLCCCVSLKTLPPLPIPSIGVRRTRGSTPLPSPTCTMSTQ